MSAIVAGWFVCLSASRYDTRLRGATGFFIGAALLGIATMAFVRAGWGLAEAIACVLGLLILAVPCASWFHAARKRSVRA